MKPQDIKNKLQKGGQVFGTMINFIEGVRWAQAFSSKALDYVIIDGGHSYDTVKQDLKLSAKILSKTPFIKPLLFGVL